MPIIEGERIAPYLRRSAVARRLMREDLLREAVAEMRRCLDLPEVLVLASAEDFLVTMRHGTSIEVILLPCFRLLQAEIEPDLSQVPDHCLAVFRRLCELSSHGSSGAETKDTKIARILRRIERLQRNGRLGSAEQVLSELDRLLYREGSRGASVPEKRLVGVRDDTRPKGMISDFLTQGVTRSYPERILPRDPARPRASFSSFILPARQISEGRGEEERLAYLLPPEDWLGEGYIYDLHRKIADPVLRDLHGTTRLRSVFAEERFSVVFGDPECGVPLPSYLSLVSLPDSSILQVLDRLGAILDQLDEVIGAERLVSPWQIQLHRLRRPGGVDQGDGEEVPFWTQPLSDWPGWELKLRVEIPTEHMIPGWEKSWEVVQARFGDGGFLPALACWMLSYERFDSMEHRREIECAAFHPVREIDGLFEAAVHHFRPGEPLHRERFLSLLREGLEWVESQGAGVGALAAS